MKTLATMACAVLLSAGLANAQQITVQGEKKLNTDFKKFKTFGWVSDSTRSPQLIEYSYAEVISADNNRKDAGKNYASNKNNKTYKNDKSQKANRHHKNNGDVVIYSYSYLIPSSDATVNHTVTSSVKEELEGRGYKEVNSNPDLLVAYRIFDSGTQIKGYDNAPTVVDGGKEIRTPQDTLTYALKPGSILITLIDTKTSDVVWEGFASGVAKNNDTINDKLKVKEAVNLIFKKYEFRGDGYTMQE